jgi:hypothetical protein
MNSKRWTIVLAVSSMLVVLACGPLGSLGDMVSGGQAGTVASLWPDVPPYPGSEQVDVELPLVMRLAVEAISKSIMAEAGDADGNLEVIAFTTTDSAAEVQSFYSQARMAAEGWSDREGSGTGCGLAPAGAEDAAAMCAFYKEGGDRDSALILVVGPDETGGNQLFFVRIDADPDAMATAAAE